MENKPKQTAVEWLIEKLDQNFDYVAATIIEQAKEMEKQQSLKLIELTVQLTSVATVDNEIAKMEFIDVYNQYYNEYHEKTSND